MSPRVATEDLVYARGVADILGLSHRNTAFQYQRKYGDMPQPVIDLGEGHPAWMLCGSGRFARTTRNVREGVRRRRPRQTASCRSTSENGADCNHSGTAERLPASKPSQPSQGKSPDSRPPVEATTGLEPATFGLGSRRDVSGSRSYGRLRRSKVPDLRLI
jgi:hypothetical protein